MNLFESIDQITAAYRASHGLPALNTPHHVDILFDDDRDPVLCEASTDEDADAWAARVVHAIKSRGNPRGVAAIVVVQSDSRHVYNVWR